MFQNFQQSLFHYNTDEGHQKIAQAVQDMWKKNLGVEVTLDNSRVESLY